MTRRVRLILACVLALTSPALAQGGFMLPAGAQPSAGTATGAMAEIDAAIAAQTQASRTEEARGARMAEELERLGRVRDGLESQVIRHGRALYRVRRAGMLPVAGGFDAMLGHLSRVERLERMVHQEIDNIRSTRERQIALQHDILRAERSVADARQQLTRLQMDRRRLEEQQQLAMLYEQTFMSPSLPLAPVAPLPGGGLSMANGGPIGPTFATMRGRLGIPTAGSYRTFDVQREDGPGVEFRTEAGAPAQVVAEGRVAFAGRYGSYGLMVIVDHGDSFFTVYAGLGSTHVNVGDSLRMGQRVGQLTGSTPLLFQVRRGTRALDARSWLGL